MYKLPKKHYYPCDISLTYQYLDAAGTSSF